VLRWTAAALTVTLLARAAAADDEVAPVDRKLHVPLTVGLGAVYFALEAPLKGPLSADECRWCGPVLFDDAVRDGLVWDDVKRARSLSNVTGYYSSPIFAIGGIGLAAALDGHGTSHWLDDGLIVAESAAITGVFTFLVKAAFARNRPFVHHGLGVDAAAQDNNQSFFSGHSSLSMSLAVSAGTVAQMRGYAYAPALYAGGIGISLATGYFRIAGDKHWTTDVVTGWLVGAAAGYLVPRLLHKRTSTEVTPLTSGSTVGFALRW
jgi:membrane-associated phospholipid phosphatase